MLKIKINDTVTRDGTVDGYEYHVTMEVSSYKVQPYVFISDPGM